MTAATVQATVRNAAANYVPPTSWHRIGQHAYGHGMAREECINDDMRAGWDAAAAEDDAGCKAYITAMYEAGEPGAAVDAVLDAHFAGFRH